MSDIRIAFLGAAIVACLVFLVSVSMVHAEVRPDTHNNAMTIEQACDAGKKLGVPVLVIFMNYETTYPEPKAYYGTLLNASGAGRQFVIAEVSLKHLDARANQIKQNIKGNGEPLYAFIDPDGNFFFGGDPATIDSAYFAHERNDLFARCRPFPQRLQSQTRRLINQAGILVDAFQFQQAERQIDKTVSGLWYPRPLIERGKAIRDFADQRGKQLLQQADASAGNVAQAMLLYDQVIDFCGPACEEGRAAARAQRELQSKNAQAVKDYQLARPQKMAEWYLTQTQTLSDDNRLDAALMLCQVIARSYGRTDVAPKAATLALSLRDRIKQRSDAARSSPDADEPDYLPMGMSPPADSAAPSATAPAP